MKLTGVSETLLIPLCARAIESRRPDAILKDERSIELVRKIGCDCRGRVPPSTQVGIVIRSRILDEQTRHFLGRSPRALVINLGAGLCTRYYRVDDGQMVWVEVDLPQVAANWGLFDEDPRHVRIAASILETDWMDRVKELRDDRQVLVLAEGLFMYLHEDQIRSVLLAIRRRIGPYEILAEAWNPLLTSNTLWNSAVRSTTARFNSGLWSFREMEEWAEGITCLGEWYPLNYDRRRWGWLRWVTHFPPLRRMMIVGHLRVD